MVHEDTHIKQIRIHCESYNRASVVKWIHGRECTAHIKGQFRNVNTDYI